ncbi:uncharacterized protein [Drosophila takahashii]|uniref:uncharacterized protein n=1 Tax=Drosophila takahashii TaxID=29030 RepID=UPI003898E88C
MSMNDILNIERHYKEERDQIDKYEKIFNRFQYIRFPACVVDTQTDLAKLFRTRYEKTRDIVSNLTQDYDSLQSNSNRSGSGKLLNDLAFKQYLIYSGLDLKIEILRLFKDTRFKTCLAKELAKANQEQANKTCRASQSPQQFLYTLFMQNVLYEAKQYALTKWSYIVRAKSEFLDYIFFKKDAKESHENLLDLMETVTKDLMVTADRTVWRCDPKDHQLGVTYEKVTRLLQGYIANEFDLSKEQTCERECPDYKFSKDEGYSDSPFSSRHTRCSGNVYDCRFVESDMKVCESDSTSDRRYEYIQFESGLVYGQKGTSRAVTNVESWHRWIFYRCSYCLCLCDDISPNSDRFFSLRPVVADVERNRVVTGVRFVKRNRVFHLQIQEGDLLPQGVINQTEWKPVDSFDVSSKDVKKDVDFHMLTYEKRSIDLDEVKVKNKSVVTGLRFRVDGTHLNLEVQFTEFDFESGQLIEPTKKSFWKSGGSDQPRNKLLLKNPNVSTQSNSSVPLSSDNQYIDFTNTGFKEDAAQSTVPFIDIQDVTSDPPVPLSGIGIYYKGLDGYGGFLGPKLITYDFSPYVKMPTWAIQGS